VNPKHKKLSGKYDSFAALLQAAGLRPTRQRMVLAKWLFSGCPKHVTVAEARVAVRKMRAGVSLATVYNVLNDFSRAGLLRQVAVSGGPVFFDTNVDAHHHLFDEKSERLSDISPSSIRFARTPIIPFGRRLSRIDVVVRVRAIE